MLTSTLQDRYREVPFLPDATYYFIAVTVATRRSAPHIRSWFADV
ncbi:MAG: hypothetical protein ACXV5Q_14290 [Frankiaceae bacterium]